MISLRCQLYVKSELVKLLIPFNAVELGQVTLTEKVSMEKLEQLAINLKEAGLELMEDKKAILVEKIKVLLVTTIHSDNDVPKARSSDFISSALNINYVYASNLFSEVTGMTIEHFIIAQKIERVKELLHYGELSLSKISVKLNYSSVSHLSKQFKKTTGITPSYYKSLKYKKSTQPEDVGIV
jgi:AraC-like DNA-binding protein